LPDGNNRSRNVETRLQALGWGTWALIPALIALLVMGDTPGDSRQLNEFGLIE
jgi:hypothetical protein